MNKITIKEYFGMYKKLGWGAVNIKEGYFPYFSMYIAFFVICEFGIQVYKQGMNIMPDTFLELSLFLPVIFVASTVGFHKIDLDKIMYLVPMEARERKEYLQGLYLFRILLYVIFTVLIMILPCIFGKRTILAAVIMLVENTVLASVVIPNSKVRSRFGEKKAIYIILFLSSFFISLYHTMDRSTLAGYIWSAVIMVVIQVPAMIRNVKNIKEDFELVANHGQEEEV